MLGIIIGIVVITISLSFAEGISQGGVREVGDMCDTYFDVHLYSENSTLTMEDVEYENDIDQFKVFGITPDYLKVNSIRMEYGRQLKEEAEIRHVL